MIQVVEIVTGAWDVIIALLLIFCTITIYYKEKISAQVQCFGFLLLVNVYFQLADMLAWIFRGNTSTLGYYMVRISNFSFYFGISLIILAYSFLTFVLIRDSGKNPSITFIRIQEMIVVIMNLLLLANIFTGGMYRFNDVNEYYRASGIMLPIHQALTYFSILNIHIICWKYRKCNHSLLIHIIRITCVLSEISGLYQVLFYGISSFNVALTAGILLFFTGALRYRSNMLHREQDLLEENKAKLTQTRQQMLQLQIQPHFMYNTMAAIQAQVLENQEKAYDSIGIFSSFLRDTINFSKREQMIRIEEELDFVEKFTNLAEMRFGDNMNIEFDIQATNFNVPAFTIQPLIENSLNHGLKPFNHEGTITIRTSQKSVNNQITNIIEVEDNGIGMNPELLEILECKAGDHIGMMNVKQRVEMACKGKLEVISPCIEDHSNGYDSVFGLKRNGTIVRISLPEVGGVLKT